jgi:L-fucose mutarotase
MLRTSLTHPEILRVLGAAGHGSQVLISDGNFPHATVPFAGAARVFLNLSPGRLTVSEVLEAVLSVLPVETAALMDPSDGSPAPRAHMELAPLLPAETPVEHIPRFDFYAATASDRLALVIATGDLRPYSNVLLTIGVIPA